MVIGREEKVERKRIRALFGLKGDEERVSSVYQQL